MRDEEKDFCDSATPRTVHSYCRLCIVPNWKYSSVYPQLSWRTHLVCRGASRVSSWVNFETKTEVLKDISTPEWQSGPTDKSNTSLDSRPTSRSIVSIAVFKSGAKNPPKFPHPVRKFKLPAAKHHYWDQHGGPQTKPSYSLQPWPKRRKRTYCCMQREAIFHPNLAPATCSCSHLPGLQFSP